MTGWQTDSQYIGQCMYGSLGPLWYMVGASGHVSCRPVAAPFLGLLGTGRYLVLQVQMGGVQSDTTVYSTALDQ